MNEKTKTDFNANWYDLWMKQSKDFFDSADTNLKDFFAKGAFSNPEAHLKEINAWLQTLKNQWEFTQLTAEQQAYQSYWKIMMQMCNQATDLMLDQWIKRAQNQQPIKTIRELYELWLDCCQQVYQKALQSNAYQKAYMEFMQAAFKFWQTATAK